MNIKDYGVCVKYNHFDTPEEYQNFVQQKKNEGFSVYDGRKGISGEQYRNPKTNEFMRYRHDAFDGVVTIWKAKKVANII